MPSAPTTTSPAQPPIGLRVVALLFTLLAASGCNDQAASPEEADAAPPCPAGELGCACDDGACTEGRCADGVCVDCPEGTLRCPCEADGACGAGLVCEQDLCAEDRCPPGSVDCPCGEGNTCDEGLTCMDSTCVPVPECPPGSLDCPCDGGACADPLVCINEVCRDCPPDVAGCPCADGACQGGLVCAMGACREAVSCAAAGCGPFQQCQEAADGADARCLEACAEGFDWDPVAGACVEQGPTCALDAPTSIAAECAGQSRVCIDDGEGATCGGCLPGFLEEGGVCQLDERANCADDPDDAHSIAADCADQQRVCVEDADGARCGACLAGLVEDPAVGCRAVNTFEECDAQVDCAEGLVCSARLPAQDARCLPPACAEGETLDLGTGACTDRCDCDGPGMTGRPWPVSDWNGDCVCETEEGFFFNTAAGSRRAELCDADGDGWTRRSAFSHLESPDEAVRLNARCPLRTIDRVVLINEAGQQLELTVETLSGGLAAAEPLFESDESDDEAETLERQGEAYGARRFHAAELNPMTKACVSALDDFNDNGISDLREHHRAAPGAQRAWMATFVAAGYFVELYTGHFVAPAAGEVHGRYVIAERSRCDGQVALGYAPGEGPYADSCWRRRDEGYEAREPVGYDFQRWSCAAPDGDCPVQTPPAPARSLDVIPPHAVCDDLDADMLGEWRGMGHASQFKCVEIIEDQAPEVLPFQRRRGEIQLRADSEARNVLNACTLTACAEGEADCFEVDVIDAADAPAINPAQPRVTCEADPTVVAADPASLVGRVGFTALRFETYDRSAEYAGGCIDEATEWSQLCPGFDPAVPGAAIGLGNPHDFGRLLCGCGLNYGGIACDQGCPDDQLHFGGTAAADEPGCFDGYCAVTADEQGFDGGRRGIWMCGGFAASGFTAGTPGVGLAFHAEGALGAGEQAPRGVITVRGHIPTFGTDGTPMCEQLDENGRCVGLTLR